MEGCQVKRQIEKELRSVKLNLDKSHGTDYLNSLQQEMLNIEGVVEIDIDTGSNQLFVDFDPEKTTQHEIERKIQQYI
jgi:allophanate hydrolase subunit 1